MPRSTQPAPDHGCNGSKFERWLVKTAGGEVKNGKGSERIISHPLMDKPITIRGHGAKSVERKATVWGKTLEEKLNEE